MDTAQKQRKYLINAQPGFYEHFVNVQTGRPLPVVKEGLLMHAAVAKAEVDPKKKL